MTELAIDSIEPEDRARTGPWTCFFCGDTFYTVHEASDHFGRDMLALAGCEIKAGEGGLLRAVREAEEDNRRHCAEDTDLHRQIHAMSADHMQALRREEEKGYERGLADGLAHAYGEGYDNARDQAAEILIAINGAHGLTPDDDPAVQAIRSMQPKSNT